MTTAGNLASRSSAGFALDKFSSSITWLQGVGTLVRRIDRVVLSLVTLMVVLAIIDAQVAWRTLGYVTSELAHLGPWFTLSVFFAAAAKATGGDAIVARAFAGREGRMIPLAAIVGGLTPFCSCGVIPLVAGLFGAGVPLAPVMAFWIASPLMDPTQFFVIAGTLGVGFAIAKAAAAIGMGLLGGYGTMLLTRAGFLSIVNALRITVERKPCLQVIIEAGLDRKASLAVLGGGRARADLSDRVCRDCLVPHPLAGTGFRNRELNDYMAPARNDRAVARLRAVRHSDCGADRGASLH
jgi:hypothetical protein